LIKNYYYQIRNGLSSFFFRPLNNDNILFILFFPEYINPDATAFFTEKFSGLTVILAGWLKNMQLEEL